jgi:hypothetical protein
MFRPASPSKYSPQHRQPCYVKNKDLHSYQTTDKNEVNGKMSTMEKEGRTTED